MTQPGYMTAKILVSSHRRASELRDLLAYRGLESLLINIGDPALASALAKALAHGRPGTTTIAGVVESALLLLEAHVDPPSRKRRRPSGRDVRRTRHASGRDRRRVP